MKKRTLGVIAFAAVFAMASLTSCGPSEEDQQKAEELAASLTESLEEAVEEAAEEVAEEAEAGVNGEELFTSNNCATCHMPDQKVVGPGLNEIAAAYADNKDGLIAFLKEEADPIVDPDQFAAMQANLAITKAMSDDELSAMADHILSH